MVNLAYDYLQLPTAEELPHSDDTPVDNELQNDIPNFILNLLRLIWEERQDWFFGVDMAVYYEPRKAAIVPDGFLAVGVPRHKSEAGRLSYVLWEEENVMPILALEVISQKYNDEYEKKLEAYQNIGILYYVIYNPLTKKGRKYKHRSSLEIYKLVDDVYQLIPANDKGIVWIPEISLGMGCEVRAFASWEREWLYLYDKNGDRYLTDREIAAQEHMAKQEAEAIAKRQQLIAQRQRLIAKQEKFAKQEAEAIASQERQEKIQERLAKQEAEQKAERLAEKLRELGFDPNEM
jgi:Uma2 family endonuclease